MIPGIEEKRLVNGVIQNGWPSYATLHQASVSLQDMGDRVITTQVRIDGDVVPSFDGWELYFKGERFVLPSDNPQAMKDNSTRNSIVDLQFQSWAIQELKRYYFFEAASVSAGVAIADKYIAPVRLNVEDFMVMLNQVLDYYFGGKIVASLYLSGQGIYSQEPKAIEINYTYLWDVIGQIFEIYGVRNRIDYNSSTGVYTIKFGYPAPEISDHDFEYGYQGGLLKFERQVQDESITNILLGRGGEKNLPYRYFKLKEENAGTTWEGDPDAIPELKDIYFDRLRDANFRWYVRGWMHNPNRDTSGDEAWDPGHVFPTYTIASTSPFYWAYQKGLTDERFNPVEYVKDDESIASYGERWGAADDNDEVYPTIQGRYAPVGATDIGRIDEVVAVSEIETDDIAAMAAAASVEESIKSMLVTYPRSTDDPILSEIFEIPSGQTGNISRVFCGPVDGDARVHIDTAQTTLVAVNQDTQAEVPVSGIPAGRYRLKLDIVLYVPTGMTASGTFGIENIVLTTSAQDANAWKPTFDIWVKNIWNTAKGANESDAEYAARVWEDILGDRAGNEAKVVFSTGFMSVSEDYKFVIASYPVFDQSKSIITRNKNNEVITVPSEWKITLRKSDAEYEATGLYIPNNTTGGKPVASDKFFFTGIDMPFLYVSLGEEDLSANKSSQLDSLKVVNPTWVISLDKVRVNTLEDGEYGQTLAEQLAAGAKLNIYDPRFSGGDVLTLYAQSVTYTWNEPSENSPYIVPDIEVVLSDKVVSRQSRTDRIESSVEQIKASYARIDDVERVVRSVAEPMFLKKTGEADSSDSPTQFASKVSSKGFRQGGVGGRGWGFYQDDSKQYAAQAQTRAASALSSENAQEEDKESVLEVDRVVVRKELQVNSLVVNQTEYRGGREIQSAAKIECTKVVYDSTAGKYVCYFDQKQGSVKNLFVVGDFAYSTEFAPDNTVVKYYRRRVDAVDVDRITLSDTVKDGSGIPTEGDLIIQYGHESNTARQYVIVRDVIGGGYERMISGLSTVNASGDEYFFAGKQDGQNPRVFVGDAAGEYAEWKNGQLNIKGRLTVMNNQGAYVSMQDYMNAVSLQFDEQQREIDKQTQSWASGEAPTAQTKPYPLWDEETQQIIGTPNFPYTQWLDDTERAKHVGDSYVDDSAGQSYRLTKKTVSGTTVYYWTRITDEEISQAISTSQQAYAAAEALQYLKSALTEGTLVEGGLVLMSMIQLGYTPSGGSYTVMAGVNGKPNSQLQDPTRSIAAWYGGPMIDHETYPSVQSYAKSLFRMDGSGYMAGGNISWQPDGDGRIPGIDWETVGGVTNVTIGANVKLESLQGSDSSVTDLIDLVRSVSGMFIDESYTEGGQTKHRIKVNPNFTGLYTDGYLSGGGLSQSAGGGGGGLDPDLMWKYLTNDPTLPDNQHITDKIAAAHLPDLLTGAGITASYTGNLYLNLALDYTAIASNLSLGDAAHRGVASSIGAGVAGLTPGSLIQSILGDGTWDSTNTVKAFVNSSIATATATFRGTNTTATTAADFITWANALTHDLNDYVFWATTDSSGNTVYKRYKYDGTNWVFEYDLNNSSFTAAQWSAINSGVTATKVGTYDTIASYFSNGLLSAAHVGDLSGTYLPKAGGTMAGDISLSNEVAIVWSPTFMNYMRMPFRIKDGAHYTGINLYNASGHVYTKLGVFTDLYGQGNVENSIFLYPNDAPKIGTYYIWHAGNLTKSVLTNLLDANGGYYLPLTGGTISKAHAFPLIINATGDSLQSAILFQLGGTNASQVGHADNHIGTWLYDYASGACINITHAGELKYNNTNPIYHSGNANKSDVAWACSTLTCNRVLSQQYDFSGFARMDLYGMFTGNAADYGTFGTIPASSTFNLYFTWAASNRTGRGWIWRGWADRDQSYTNIAALDLAGNYSIAGNFDTPGVIHATTGIWTDGYLSSGGLSQSSDRRLKTAIKDFAYSKALLMAIRPREWDWNGKAAMKGHAAGFVAQEIEKLMPYAVDNARKYKALFYDQFHALEVAALQDHETRLVAIEKENEAIRKENVALRLENRQLRERLNMN